MVIIGNIVGPMMITTTTTMMTMMMKPLRFLVNIQLPDTSICQCERHLPQHSVQCEPTCPVHGCYGIHCAT